MSDIRYINKEYMYGLRGATKMVCDICGKTDVWTFPVEFDNKHSSVDKWIEQSCCDCITDILDTLGRTQGASILVKIKLQ